MSTKRFRIAFSFTGEKRDFVAEIAAMLAQRFGQDKILYDKYHEAEFARSDLAFYLPDLYEKEADLVVAVFCPDYDKKEWCGLEWSAIFGLLKVRKVDEVCRGEVTSPLLFEELTGVLFSSVGLPTREILRSSLDKMRHAFFEVVTAQALRYIRDRRMQRCPEIQIPRLVSRVTGSPV